jgi:hypothetical protein
MTELLQKAIAQIEKLPIDEQNTIASRWLAELEDEEAWKSRFQATTEEQWDRIAEMVHQEIAAGDIDSIELQQELKQAFTEAGYDSKEKIINLVQDIKREISQERESKNYPVR